MKARRLKVNGVNHYTHFLLEAPISTHNVEDQILKLWTKFFKFLESDEFSYDIKTVFVHNLGGFDGYFLYKGLLLYQASNQHEVEKEVGKTGKPMLAKTIIDPHNRFIFISTGLITFKDSFRIFPVSLNDLCKVFEVPGKLSEYNKSFNNLDELLSSSINQGDESSVNKFPEQSIENNSLLP